jgi:hypothetical protein
MAPNIWRAICTAFVLLVHPITTVAQADITQDSFFYGQSPPVYPSRTYKLSVNSTSVLNLYQLLCLVQGNGQKHIAKPLL